MYRTNDRLGVKQMKNMKRNIFALVLLSAIVLPLQADNWMKRLPDDAYISTLSIPGSHDSGTGNGFPGISTSI